MAELDVELMSSVVRGSGKEFLRGIVWWMIVAVPVQASVAVLKSIEL